MPNALWFYRRLLKLYPRSFQAEYTEPMIQTLNDMLDDQSNTIGKFVVWLRVSGELPFYAFKESLQNIGDNGMKKPAFINKRLVFITAVLALGLGVTFGGNWLKNNLAPRVVARATNSSSVQRLEALNTTLAKPFGSLTNTEPTVTHNCQPPTTRGIEADFYCDTSFRAYFKLDQSESQKRTTLQQVQATERALQAVGFKPGDNGVTLTSLVAGTYEGKDYSPDAFYQYSATSDTCVFSANIAYRNPATPAISLGLSCPRQVRPLGDF